ncbi:hypothetical protein Tco_0973047 [Tanacetum coccineum]
MVHHRFQVRRGTHTPTPYPPPSRHLPPGISLCKQESDNAIVKLGSTLRSSMAKIQDSVLYSLQTSISSTDTTLPPWTDVPAMRHDALANLIAYSQLWIPRGKTKRF